MRVRNFLRDIYFSDRPLTRKDYYNSRNLFIYEGAIARTIFTLATGAFFAGFARYMGASDQLNGILAAVPVLAGLVQVFSPLIFEKLERRKFLISFFCLIHRTLLGLVVFIPLVVSGSALGLWLVGLVYLLSFMLVSFITPAVSGLLIDLTPDNTRGRYFGIRESYIIAVVTVVTLVMGRVLDIFSKKDMEYTGFLVVFVFILVLALADFYFLSVIKEPPVKKSDTVPSLKEVVSIPLKDLNFRKVIIMFALWNVGLQVGSPFFAVYMVTGLKLQYTYIMIMSMISSLANILTVRLWGKLADKKSWVFTTKASVALLAATHLGWFLVNSSTAFILVPLLHSMGGVAWAGINISIFNIQFTFTPQQGRTIYLGFNAALNGLVGFTSSLAGSLLVGVFSMTSLRLAGFTAGNMQVVFAVSGVILGCCASYIHYFIKMADNSETEGNRAERQ